MSAKMKKAKRANEITQDFLFLGDFFAAQILHFFALISFRKVHNSQLHVPEGEPLGLGMISFVLVVNFSSTSSWISVEEVRLAPSLSLRITSCGKSDFSKTG